MQLSRDAQEALTPLRSALGTMRHQEAEPYPDGSDRFMELFAFSIPLMVLAVAIAVVPLIVMSCADHRRRTDEQIARRIPAPGEHGA